MILLTVRTMRQRQEAPGRPISSPPSLDADSIRVVPGPADGGGLPGPGGPRRTAERALPPWMAGRRMPGQVPGVAVVEVVGETIRGLKGVRVAEEGLVAAEKGEACHG